MTRPLRQTLLCLALALPAFTGCMHRNYYPDPKPARVSFDNLRIAEHPKPVQLVFDVYNEHGPFLEATRKLAPKALEVVMFSRLFSSIVKVGSDNMPRLQLVLTERGLPEAGEAVTQPVPPNISSSLPGTTGGVIYTLTATYQTLGKEPVKKVYNHAVHVADSGPKPEGVKSMRALSAVEDIVEQMILSFLVELQKSDRL